MLIKTDLLPRMPVYLYRQSICVSMARVSSNSLRPSRPAFYLDTLAALVGQLAFPLFVLAISRLQASMGGSLPLGA